MNGSAPKGPPSDMGAYVARRLLLMIPTLLGIMVINFALVQFVPGGPVEQIIASLEGGGDVFAGIAGTSSEVAGGGEDGGYTGARGLPQEFIDELNAQFGFDKPPLERFLTMMWDYMRFDFGESYFRSISVVDLVLEKMPVSLSLGLWSTLIAYAISIPLGIRKAMRDGTGFDTWTSGVVVVAYAIPGFLFAILLLVLFAGGSFLQIFPLRGLTSDNWAELSLLGKVADYFWHIALPVTASVISAFAGLTLLTKNSFMEEIRKQYVVTAKAKGLSERRVLYGHVFRNAMLIVIAGFPAAFVSVFFGASLIIETIFSLDGLGRLGFEAAVSRDYPVMFGTLFTFSLIGLVMGLITDLTYIWVDPRIDFESRET